jgi:hypothetical protein
MDWISDAVENTFARWGSDARPTFDRENAAKMLAIGLGLDALFNGDADAERLWMQTPHQELKTRPITAVLAGALDEVLMLVNAERNLR